MSNIQLNIPKGFVRVGSFCFILVLSWFAYLLTTCTFFVSRSPVPVFGTGWGGDIPQSLMKSAALPTPLGGNPPGFHGKNHGFHGKNYGFHGKNNGFRWRFSLQSMRPIHWAMMEKRYRWLIRVAGGCQSLYKMFVVVLHQSLRFGHFPWVFTASWKCSSSY